MRRREFLGVLAGLATAWPLAAHAQQRDGMRRIGVMFGVSEDNPEGQMWLSVFVQTLASLGWTRDRNARIEVRWTGGDAAKIKAYAAELVGLKSDAILVSGTAGTSALRRETRAIPLVGVQVIDPVASGFAESLAHPGGNFTGFTNFEDSIGGKWLGTLMEVAPHIERVAVLASPANVAHPRVARIIETSARSLGVHTVTAYVRSAADIEPAFGASAMGPKSGLVVLPDTVTASQGPLIARLAAQHQSPAIYPFRYFTANGGLMSYGLDQSDFYRRAAGYVSRILRGEKPADLPVQGPTKFELVINLKVARALGLSVPESFLLRADEVIE